jgi:hypothetical protein
MDEICSEFEDLILALSDVSEGAPVSDPALQVLKEDRRSRHLALREEFAVLLEVALVEMKLHSLQILKATLAAVVVEAVTLSDTQSAARFKEYVDMVGGAIVARMGALSESVAAAGDRIASLELSLVSGPCASLAGRICNDGSALAAVSADRWHTVTGLPGTCGNTGGTRLRLHS